MKNWETLDADVNMILNKHFNTGRNGRKIDKVILHHNAGNLTVEGCYNVWQTRQASAHYQVDINGTIGQLVWDSDTAWHAGNSEANLTSIGIEHANNNRNPWTISDATLDAGAHLVASICKKFNLGEPQWLVNVFPHSYFSSTECPGEIAKSQKDKYMATAKKYYHEMMGTADKPTGPAKTVSELAQEVIQGKWGNGGDRYNRLTNAGYNFDEVQKEVNRILGYSSKKSNEQIAKEVIQGKWGNGNDRYNRLTKAGYDYDAIQKLVNKML